MIGRLFVVIGVALVFLAVTIRMGIRRPSDIDFRNQAQAIPPLLFVAMTGCALIGLAVLCVRTFL